MKHAEQDDNGYYRCPECHKILKSVYDYSYDFMYHLQCPENRQHCYIVHNNLDNVAAASLYEPVNLEKCPECGFILHYDKSNHCLVCPVNNSHMNHKISEEEASKRGYKIYDKSDNTSKLMYIGRKTNPQLTLTELMASMK